jgi:hypothetical protein
VFQVPATSTIFDLAKNVCSTDPLLHKKYTRQNAAQIKEKHGENRARLKHFPHKSPAQLAQQA